MRIFAAVSAAAVLLSTSAKGAPPLLPPPLPERRDVGEDSAQNVIQLSTSSNQRSEKHPREVSMSFQVFPDTNPWAFKVVPDIFIEPPVPEGLWDEKCRTQANLGLLPKKDYPTDEGGEDGERDWSRLVRYVRALNEEAGENVQYKVLYLHRHGTGHHNIKHQEVGADAWENNWSLKDGDGKTTWFDSDLAPKGEEEIREQSKWFKNLITNESAPLPQAIYVSPMSRTLQTCKLLWGPVFPNKIRPVIKEDLREGWTLHTCDRHRSKSWIEENWVSQGYKLEDNFPERDLLGMSTEKETDDDVTARMQRALEDIWDREPDKDVVALVMHSVVMQSLLGLIRTFQVKVHPGTTLAFLVKGVKGT